MACVGMACVIMAYVVMVYVVMAWFFGQGIYLALDACYTIMSTIARSST